MALGRDQWDSSWDDVVSGSAFGFFERCGGPHLAAAVAVSGSGVRIFFEIEMEAVTDRPKARPTTRSRDTDDTEQTEGEGRRFDSDAPTPESLLFRGRKVASRPRQSRWILSSAAAEKIMRSSAVARSLIRSPGSAAVAACAIEAQKS